jgi:chromatin segregation and condensation protein Rec8/ScpA/Scc1 (kleisin family)
MRVVGIFLAALELVRRGTLITRQEQLFDEIWLEYRLPTESASEGLS